MPSLCVVLVLSPGVWCISDEPLYYFIVTCAGVTLLVTSVVYLKLVCFHGVSVPHKFSIFALLCLPAVGLMTLQPQLTQDRSDLHSLLRCVTFWFYYNSVVSNKIAFSVRGRRLANAFLLPWPWPDCFDVRTGPEYSDYILANWKQTFQVEAFISVCNQPASPVPSVLWHCWLGHLTHKNPSPIWPIMCLVGR